jgi:signal transduction histidine kinase/DNA-binding response OmpR family regulator
MSREVSCRIVQAVMEYAERQGIHSGALCRDMPYSQQHLRNKQERIDWAAYCTMMGNLRSRWTDDDFERLGVAVLRSVAFRNVMSVARLLFDGPDAYIWWTSGSSSPGKQTFTCIDAVAERVSHNRVLVTLTLHDGYPFFREFFLVTKGSFTAGSTLLGLDQAQVTMRETERGAVYDITCPEEGGAWSRFRRFVSWPFAARETAKELADANRALHDRYIQLEAAREEVQRQAKRLKIAYDISRLSHANLNLDSTLEGIAGAMVSIGGFAGASLRLDLSADDNSGSRVFQAGTPTEGGGTLSRLLEGHGRTLGEILLWLPDQSDAKEAGDLLDFLIPTITTEINDAVSFTQVDDYRGALERKVEQRTRELQQANTLLKEAQAVRARLFANISHEFRTPLTLILGPADQVLAATQEPSTGSRLKLIKDNALRLLGLVNQLLDVSRIESQTLRLQVVAGDMARFVARIVAGFSSWAESKHITLEFHAEEGAGEAWFDPERLETILNNLISNALKFTGEGGTVEVRQFRIQNSEFRIQSCGIEVTDSGPGISSEHIPYIFDRFYRVDDSHATEGTGIGLALTKELVTLHHGTIGVESSPGRGSTFTVTFPISPEAYGPAEMGENRIGTHVRHSDTEVHTMDSPGSRTSATRDGIPLVLIVEDSDDLRSFVRGLLVDSYNVIEAAGGMEGFSCATDAVPDIVVSDVMMPGMDGIELCRALKGDRRTSHIPVILLTARAGTESRIEGFAHGADDYLTKPFEADELLVRVRNLIEQRRLLRARFSAGVVLKPGDVVVSSVDDDLLNQVMRLIEERMGDENFEADELARAVSLSRRHLDRKLKALTDLSCAELIRYIRLQRAHQILGKGRATIAEVAYQVGFKNPSHFTTAFRDRFGSLPSEIRSL